MQVVCLTAALPPQREIAFMSTMDIEPAEVNIIREITVRPNIAYSVVAYDGRNEEAFITAAVAAKFSAMEHFAEVIGGIVFHSTVGDMAKKRDIVAMLTEGHERLFWSTGALEEGIDAATVLVVVHVGVVDTLDDFAQQSGGAGRDGVTASESIVLRRFDVREGGRQRFASSGKEEAGGADRAVFGGRSLATGGIRCVICAVTEC
ncbi:hypothetical protein LTR22_025864 [Elasticomyces elasticus]|nr:hypothetical protein LTR22_025864 [Elasticomyces elasticus]